MIPYLAILEDSLREAIHSRVLWLLLGCILLVLLALSPIAIHYPPTATIARSDIQDILEFSRLLVAAGQSEETSLQFKIWDALDSSLKSELERLTAADDPEGRTERRVATQLTTSLNTIIERDDVFDSNDVTATTLPREGRELATIADRSVEQERRLNRLIIESAFPRQLGQRGGQSTQVSYLIWPVGEQIPASGRQVEQFIGIILTGFTNFFLGFVGVFAGILVTASIIPNTFDGGSVNLLLSKPISRSLLYLTKLIGGCWFVAMNAAVLVLGVWLIAGFRLGIWNHRLLWSIPLFLFVFLVYYSVSAFAGLVWRNTIVAVGVTIVFWLICFLVGTTHEMISNLLLQPQRLVHLVYADSTYLSSTETGRVQRWNDETKLWDEVFTPDARSFAPAFAQENDLVGPVYDTHGKRLVAADRRWARGHTYEATAANDWQRERLGSAPRGTRELIVDAGGRIYAVSRSGLASLAAQDEPPKRAGLLGSTLPALADRLLSSTEAFRVLGPMGKDALSDSAAVFVIPQADLTRLLAMDHGKLLVFSRKVDGRFRLQAEQLVGERDDLFLIAATPDTIVVVDQSGLVRLLDAHTFKEISRQRPYGKIEPRFALASPDAAYVAVVFHDGRVWLYDARRKTNVSNRLPGQGGLSAISFLSTNGASRALVADRTNRVREVDLSDGRIITSLQPVESLLVRVYRFVILPIYRLFPKPSSLSNTNQYLLTDSKTLTPATELRSARPVVDPWAPVISSGAFALLMVALGCWYIGWQEF